MTEEPVETTDAATTETPEPTMSMSMSMSTQPVPTPAFGGSSSSPVGAESNSLMSPRSSLIDPPNGVTWCSGSTNIGRLFSIVLFTWMVLLE
jgi:hypothetical protein